MRFLLDPEQRAFAASLDALLTAADTPAVVREWSRGDHASGRALWARLAEAGVFALAVPEAYEGLGPRPVELAVAFMELGRHAVPGPLVETVTAAALLAEADPGTAKRLLPALASGETMATVTPPRTQDTTVANGTPVPWAPQDAGLGGGVPEHQAQAATATTDIPAPRTQDTEAGDGTPEPRTRATTATTDTPAPRTQDTEARDDTPKHQAQATTATTDTPAPRTQDTEARDDTPSTKHRPRPPRHTTHPGPRTRRPGTTPQAPTTGHDRHDRHPRPGPRTRRPGTTPPSTKHRPRPPRPTPRTPDPGHEGQGRHPQAPSTGHDRHDRHPRAPDPGHEGRGRHPQAPSTGHDRHDRHPRTPDPGHGGQGRHPRAPDTGRDRHGRHPRTPDPGRDHPNRRPQPARARADAPASPLRPGR
ncbi:hypothetical protein C1703_09390 [Streptomyces sp. Go-475]|nr:hypothetical protein C1703_09390 [Streptomyces sp. Go-475]